MAERRCYGCMKPIGEEKVCPHCGFDGSANEVHQLPIGIVLQGRYFIGRVLGQGGFGITYIGWDGKTQTPVAIKEFFPSGMVHRQTSTGLSVTSYLGESTQAFDRNKARFVKEANSLRQMRGLPEIVQVMDYFQENNTAYIVMEYVEGITLKKYIKQHTSRPDPNEILKLIKPLLPALHDVHKLHLIHRDISPDNIMLPKKGGIKLIDFGTVRYMDDTNLSKSTEAILKPGFAPMEQYQNHGRLGPWTDVYALCGTIYYCLTGKVPQDAPSRMVDNSGLEIEKLVPGIDKRIADALEAGMAIRAENRLQSVDELYEMLYGSGHAPNRTVTVTKNDGSNGGSEVSGNAAVSGTSGAAENKQAGKSGKKNLLPVLSVAVAGCCIALFLFAVGSGKGDSGKKTDTDTTPETTMEYVQMAFDGWVSSGGYRYYYVSGEPLVGWHTIEGEEYYFDEEGRAAIGRTVQIGEDSYFFDAYGRVKTVTYAHIPSNNATGPFTTGGQVRNIAYQQLSRPVTDCIGFEFALRTDRTPGTDLTGTWVICLRSNGIWTSCATVDMTSMLMTDTTSFADPVTFDAYMAYRIDTTDLDNSCPYELINVKVNAP